MTAKLQLIRAAPAIHFQDLGRFGVAHHGFSQGGPLDLHAHCWANYLLENDSGCTTLEISYGNTALLALEDTHFSLAGAEMRASIEGEPCANWSSHMLKKGATLKLNYASKGIHAYLAIQDGFLAPKTLKSTATVIRNSIGEYCKEGMEFHSTPSNSSNQSSTRKSIAVKSIAVEFIPDYSDHEIRVIMASNQGHEILDDTFEVSPASDRMGMNLIAKNPLPFQPGIISEGTSLGTMQLLPDGNVIVLLNDRQSQGGYAKIANIARVDLPLLTQSMPGTEIKLKAISMEQATKEWDEFAKFFQL